MAAKDIAEWPAPCKQTKIFPFVPAVYTGMVSSIFSIVSKKSLHFNGAYYCYSLLRPPPVKPPLKPLAGFCLKLAAGKSPPVGQGTPSAFLSLSTVSFANLISWLLLSYTYSFCTSSFDSSSSYSSSSCSFITVSAALILSSSYTSSLSKSN